MQQYLSLARSIPIHPGLEALADAFLMVDGNWVISYWNRASEQMFGSARAQVVGRELWKTLPCLGQANCGEMLRRVAAGGEAERSLEMMPGIERRVISIHASPLEGGGLAIQVRDATEEMTRSEHYSELLESLQNGFVAVDEAWRVVYMNGMAESLLRLRRERARNASIWALLPPASAELSECLRSTMADGVKRHLRAVRPAGRIFRDRIYDVWTYRLSGGGISILFEDVSERVQREEKLARLATQAQEANRTKSRFFAAISHELRTPLNAIVGYTHLLSSGTYGALPELAVRAADRAGICAEHLCRLVDDLLLLTSSELRRLRPNLAPVAIGPFLEGALEPYRHQAEAKGLAFELRLPDRLPTIETDVERLRQILAALLANAIKFTSRGSIGMAVRADPTVLEFTVTDTGCGLDPADSERIFAPFEQLGDSARPNPILHGSGLGLTVARQLATLLGGSLTLAATSPAGSRFVLRLPGLTYPVPLARGGVKL